jgi:hypothetical protein
VTKKNHELSISDQPIIAFWPFNVRTLMTVDSKSPCWRFDDMFKSWLISAMGAVERLTRQPRPHGSALLWPEFSVVYQPLQQASLREQFPGHYTAIDK